jgi:hypothetical protein
MPGEWVQNVWSSSYLSRWESNHHFCDSRCFSLAFRGPTNEKMTNITSVVRAVIISSMLLGCLSAKGQDGFLNEKAGNFLAQIQSQSSEIADVIIIDTGCSVNSYPSMEEEMEMYIDLRSELPLAFFFPNPSNGIIWIEHNLGSDTTIIIRDVTGQVMLEAQYLNAKKLDLTDFNKGSYFIQLLSKEKQITQTLEVI